jgi:hypothetical protein
MSEWETEGQGGSSEGLDDEQGDGMGGESEGGLQGDEGEQGGSGGGMDDEESGGAM